MLRTGEATHRRQEALFAQKLLSDAEWDQATSRDTRRRGRAAQAARQEVARADAAVAAAADNLRKTRFEAPFDGVVSALNVEAGENVITGTMNNPGTEILVVSDLSRMLVRADVDETDVVDMRVGQKARDLRGRAAGHLVPRHGHRDRQHRQALGHSRRSRARRTSRSRWCSTRTCPRCGPGMNADVEIETGTHAKTLGVPIQAVVVRTQSDLDRAAHKPGARAKKPAKKAKGLELAADEDTVGRKEKEITGVFVVAKESVARFVPVRTGIAGESSIEVIGRGQGRRPGGGGAVQGAAGPQAGRAGEARGGGRRAGTQVRPGC